MTMIKLPEGVEVDLKVYLVGMIEENEVEIALTLGGMPAISDSVHEYLDLQSIIASQNLLDLGTDWRVMTRPEISDYKKRQTEREEIEAP